MADKITPQTKVRDAAFSCPEAEQIFKKHDVNPHETCKGMYENISLEEAAEWCGMKDMPGLVNELNAALTKK